MSYIQIECAQFFDTFFPKGQTCSVCMVNLSACDFTKISLTNEMAISCTSMLSLTCHKFLRMPGVHTCHNGEGWLIRHKTLIIILFFFSCTNRYPWLSVDQYSWWELSIDISINTQLASKSYSQLTLD